MSTVTISDFVRYREMKKECRRLARQVEYLEGAQTEIAAGKVKRSLPYFPYTEEHSPVVGLIGNTARIAAKKDALQDTNAQAAKLHEKLMGFLDTVDDVDVRETLELYYIDGLTYCDVAEAMGMDGDGSVQMKKAHNFMRDIAPAVKTEETEKTE